MLAKRSIIESARTGRAVKVERASVCRWRRRGGFQPCPYRYPVMPSHQATEPDNLRLHLLELGHPRAVANLCDVDVAIEVNADAVTADDASFLRFIAAPA